ncbi:MAG: hypothetical protein IJS91_04420 [Bacteroidales bacterium]|nr:hypothetical protein [Bacteroidales bacterium]
MKITNESFLKKVSEINDRIEFLDEYKGYRKKIKCRCKDCGYVWMSTPASLYKSQKCPSCFGTHNNRERNLLMRNSFVKKVQEINPSITIIGEYTRLTDTIKCKCNNCGNEWTPYANNLLKGYGCPKCSKSGTSFMEQLLLLVLINAFNGKCEVVSRDRSVIGMELDILIPTLKVAIEPGSWSMHKKALKRDTEKRRLCNEHGIRIITIYDSYTEEKPPFKTDCLVFPYDLGSEKNHSTLRNIIVPFLFHLLGLNAEFDDPSWRGFEQEAKKRSLALSTESFKERIKAISPTITILGDYVSEKTPIKCKCEICGYVWDAFPSNLFKGRGCFKCNGNPPKNTSLFQKELSVINPKIIVLGEYKSSKQRIRCKCAECGYEWEAFPGNLLRGHGCTNCFNMRRRNSSKRKSHETFVSQIESINPNIEIVGSYVNDSTKIECRCRICGNQWMPYATNLLRGHGCPICARTWRKTLGN